MKKLLLFLVALLFATTSSWTQTTDFESFTVGTVNYQGTGTTTTYTSTPPGYTYTIPNPYGSLWTVADEWGSSATAYDQEVKDDGTGNKVWRISNAVISGGLSDQSNSPSSAQPAGESLAALWNDRGPNHTSPLSPPLLRAAAATKYFHGGFKFKSATGAAQPDLFISVSAVPRQSSIRNSYIGISDNGTGFDIEFYETLSATDGIWSSPGSIIATNLSYTDWHEIDVYIEFVDLLNVDGSGNDIVTVMLDGTVIHTGTTWETFYADASWSATPYPVAVDALAFIARGTAVPATSGNGLYFDDVTIDNAQVPGPPSPITTIETPTSTACGVYDVDVTVQDFSNVGSISLVLDFDPLVFAYQSTAVTLNPAISSASPNTSIPGQFRLGYFGNGIYLADDAVLFTLHFDLLPAISGTTTNLTWSTVSGDNEYAGPNGSPVYTSTFNDLIGWLIPVRPVKNITTSLEYCKIQDAIDYANANDIIEVSTGTYNEDLVFNVSGIELRPKSGNAVTIKGVDTEPIANWPLANPNIEILANGVKIHGFTIQSPAYVSGYYSSGIVIGAANVEIYDNDFEVWAGNDVVGDEISQAIQTYFKGAMPGVDISGLTIYDNTFIPLNSGTQWGYEGIYVNLDEGTGTITIANNDFSGELVRAITVERSKATISGNTIITDLPPYASPGALEGISIRYAGPGGPFAQSNIAISGNEVKGSGTGKGFLRGVRLGISGQTLTGITVTGNNLSGNTIGALVRSSANGVLINTNNITGNTTGVINEDASNILDAENNWWGHASGPSGVAYGSGDAVSDYVDYCPWLGGLYPGGAITSNILNTTLGSVHCTIQDAIDNATTGNVITVAPGTYNENLNITVGVTLQGANAGIPCYQTRGNESTIVGFASAAITIASDGVTIDGFEITNPAGNYAITATGRNNLSIENNIIHHIGTFPVLSGNTHAVAIAMGSTANIANVNISENCFSDILGGEDPALSGALAKANNGSASAIAVGWSTADFDISTLNIENNFISNVNACTNIWEEGGKGAYGVSIGVGANALHFGKAVSPVIHYNTISDLEGLWAHGVGLEGETPGAVVNNNEIYDLTDHKTPSDATGILLEQNDGAGTVGLHDNSLTNMGMRIVNLMAGKVDATCNWYGTTDPTTISTLIYGNMNVNPYLISGVNTTAAGLPGFIPTASCLGYFPIYNFTKDYWFVSIQAAIDAAITTDGDLIQVKVADFTEPGFVRITKALTIEGLGKTATIVRCNVDMNASGHGDDAAIWISGSAGKTITIQDMTLDATGKDVGYAVVYRHSGLFKNVAINEIKHSASQYRGMAVQVLDGDVDVEGCTFTEIGRIGVHYRAGVIAGAVISGLYDNNEYTGKGDGDWLDYALDISGGTTIDVTNSTVTLNTGEALSDGSTSAGVLVTTYFPYLQNVPNNVTITNNFLTGNTDGVAVGYDASDVSVATINNNDLSGNTTYGVNSTTPTVDATCNWWGYICGSDIANYVNGPVSFTSWLIGNTDLPAAGFQPQDPCTGVFPVLQNATMQANRLSVGGPTWDYLVSGDLSGGFSMCITPDISSFYLDINTLTSSPGLLVDFLNPFTLDQTSLPATWLPYWASKGVDGGGPYGDWRDQMWLIINGNAPFFYIKYKAGSDYIMVDGLKHWMGAVDPVLELPGDYPNHIYTYTGNITDVVGCVSLPINVTMDFHTCDISGTLAYNNTAQTGLNNMTVTLNSTPSVSATTGTDGSYTLSNVQSGTHSITFNDNGLTAGGINATDAAQVNYWGTTPWSIEKVRFFAGDVDNNNNVLAADAGLILAYFVNAGNSPHNFTPIWKFWLAGDPISANPYGGLANPSVTVLSTSMPQGLYGLCTGDFNQSFIPGLTKAASESLLLKEGKNIFAEVGTELELPIVAGMDMDLGAVSLILNFPSDKVEISEVFLTSDPSSSLMFNIAGDELRIGWNSLIPAYLNEGESLITLKMKVIDESGVEGISLSLEADPLNELANGDFFVINDAVLIADVIHTSALGIANNVADRLALANHPNPFKGTTNFVYSLPVDGKVILEIYDLIGNKVMTVVDEAQTAGEYTIKLDANRLQPGVYTATLRLSNEDSKLVRTIKILSR